MLPASLGSRKSARAVTFWVWGVCCTRNRPRLFIMRLNASLSEAKPACSSGCSGIHHAGRSRTDAGDHSVPRALPGQYKDIQRDMLHFFILVPPLAVSFQGQHKRNTDFLTEHPMQLTCKMLEFSLSLPMLYNIEMRKSSYSTSYRLEKKRG